MGVARNGSVELYFESFGSDDHPTLLLVSNLLGDCTFYEASWCELFVTRGYQVVRFDLRDSGMSSRCDGVDYSLTDLAEDAAAVAAAVTDEPVHVLGHSLGGMIVQRLAVEHPDRLLSMTSVSSSTGESAYGRPSAARVEHLQALTENPPPDDRESAIRQAIDTARRFGSKPEWEDADEIRALVGRVHDRSHNPAGLACRRAAAVNDPDRVEQLRALSVPTLVIHGSLDQNIGPDGGRRTAELIPGARLEIIDGMAHRPPPAVWPTITDIWSSFTASL